MSWQLWRDMARDSQTAAQAAMDAGHLRSAASRFYYAAYQMATAVLLQRGWVPPADREAWSHADTPALLEDALVPVFHRDKRRDLARRLTTLYDLRVDADYRSAAGMDEAKLVTARKNCGYLIGELGGVLPEQGGTP